MDGAIKMAEPVSGYAGFKIGHFLAIGAGGLIAGGLLTGRPWYERAIAATSGCLAAIVLTPLFSPIAIHFWGGLFQLLNIPPEEMSREAVSNGASFLIGLTGIDICRWLIDKTKATLASIVLPFSRTKQDPPSK